MKKTFIGLFAGSLLTGVLAVSAPAATAMAPVVTAVAGPYTGTVPTQTSSQAPGRVKANKRVRIKIKIASPSTQVPKGKIVIQAVNRKSGKLVQRVSYNYDPARGSYPLGKLPKGQYKIITKFIPFKKSIFKRSTSISYTRVV